MGNRITYSRNNITPTVAQDIMQILSAASRRSRIIQIAIGGLGTSSAAQGVTVGRASGGTTPGGPLTADKFDHSDQPAAVTVVNTTWSVQPTLGNSQIPLNWNALGGAIIWNAPAQGNKLECRNGEFLSIRCPAAGTTPQPMSIAVVVEED